MRDAAGVLLLILLLAGCMSVLPTTTSTPDSPTTHTLSQSSPGSPGQWIATDEVVTVTEVVDGDTADIEYPNGTTDRIRLLGIDTPETHVENAPAEFEGVPETEAGHEWLSDWGERADVFLRERIEDEEVRIVTDERADRRGGYDRLLVYVYQNGTNLNRVLLQRGYARLYDSSFSLRDRFAAVESRARSAERGLWGFDVNRTATGRESASAVSVLPSRS